MTWAEGLRGRAGEVKGEGTVPRPRVGRLAVRDERCYTGVMLRDRYFFPLCAAVAIAMIVVAMAGPWGANPAKPDPSAPAREQTR